MIRARPKSASVNAIPTIRRDANDCPTGDPVGAFKAAAFRGPTRSARPSNLAGLSGYEVSGVIDDPRHATHNGDHRRSGRTEPAIPRRYTSPAPTAKAPRQR